MLSIKKGPVDTSPVAGTPIALDSFAALRYKDFRAYFGIRFFFTLASQMQATVIGFYVYQLTHSKMAIAFIGLSEIIPALGIALYGGYIADRQEKRKMLLLIYTGVLATSGVLFAVTLKNVSDHLAINAVLYTIYACLFCNGIARAFYEPAIFSVYAHSVPREVYPNASSWGTISWLAASIVGPMAGGFLYAFAGGILPGVSGLTVTFSFITLLLALAWGSVYRLRKCPAVAGPQEDIRKSLWEGVHFVFTNKMILYTMSLDLFSVFFGGVTALLPIYALDILHVGPEGLGIMRMAFSLGAALTMLALVRFSPMGKPWRNLLLTVAGFGGAVIGFGLSHSLGMALVFLFAQGAFDSVSMIIRGTLLQLLTPDRMRGRVSAVNSMFIGSSAEIGNFESGIAARLLGTIPAVLFGGSMTLLIVVFTYFRTRKLLGLGLGEIHVEERIYMEKGKKV